MADRLEERLPDALRRHSGDYESVAGLAAGARARATRRGRRRTAGTVAAAALAVAAVPTALALTGSSPSVELAPSPPATSDVAPEPDRPSGFRVESWRNLTVSVPPDWGYGGGTDWCGTDGAPGGAEVTRPEAGVRSVRCRPRLSYGLYFGDGPAAERVHDSGDVWQYSWGSRDQMKMYPESAWLGLFEAADHFLVVVTSSEELTRAILESVRRVEHVDPNGCAPRDGEDAAAGDGDRWSVCRYTGDGWLVQSELLSAEQSEQFLTAVRSAPLRLAPPGSCPAPAPEDDSVGRVIAGNDSDLGPVSVVFESFCPGENGVFMPGTLRELTADVLYWAISPGWSGGVDGSVPLPDPFRQN